MISKILTASTQGLKTFKIEVEADIHPSLPSVTIVGLPDKSIQESRERVRSSIVQSGYEFPLGKITINLAPADIVKVGTGFDLPIALSILTSNKTIKEIDSKSTLFIGELALDGQLRKVNNIISICLWARENNINRIFLPDENKTEAALISGIDIYPVSHLKQLVNHLNNKEVLKKLRPLKYSNIIKKFSNNKELLHNDMAYVKGQKVAKRALEISAAGGHNVLLIGSPGSGKTLLAKSYPTILPKMTEKEILETTQIYSAAGLLDSNTIILQRPFRSPHHTASHISLVGGGAKLKPGEISLAHRGVLFLDEFPEFKRETVESLRQPLEDGYVTITRASGSVTYPSQFYLLAAANPTPAGYNTDDSSNPIMKVQNQRSIDRYQSKFSGPILDRIDIQVEVDSVSKEDLQSDKLSESSYDIAQRVQLARDMQTKRFEKENIHSNAEMSLPLIKKYAKLNPDTEKVLDMAIEKFNLSARGYIRVLKISRTIADLNKNKDIQLSDVTEALQYRGKWMKN